MNTNKPIKRHPAFVALSKDHHFGLLLVWKIKEGLISEVGPERITNYVLYFFEEDLRHHFREEEQYIFSKLPADDTLRRQAEAEHAAVYALVEELKHNKQDKALLQRFATTLDSHIRFEERVLFNHMQETLTPAQLEEIIQQVPDRREDCDTKWTDQFWVKSKG